MTKNYFFVLIASFFVAGFIFMALPDEAYSGMPTLGCCQNNNSGNCIPGTQTAEQCMDNLPQRTWFPNDPPCVGGEACASFTPTGCCDFDDDGDECSEDVTEDFCESTLDGEWFEGDISCEDDRCGEAVGCCSNSDSNTCDNNIEEGNCDGDFDTWSEGEVCNGVRTCGQIGCCQLDIDPGEDPMCDLTNFEDCDEGPPAEWTSNDACTPSGLCASNIIGCCVFGPNDCSEISEQQCELQEGLFEGPGSECSEIPICNVVASPIPTLNQWGLIAVAGLLGLFSLFIIIRRHRYNIG